MPFLFSSSNFNWKNCSSLRCKTFLYVSISILKDCVQALLSHWPENEPAILYKVSSWIGTKTEVDRIAKTGTSPNTLVSVCSRVLSRVLASSQRVC